MADEVVVESAGLIVPTLGDDSVIVESAGLVVPTLGPDSIVVESLGMYVLIRGAPRPGDWFLLFP